MSGNMIIGQSGGPTAVINASLAGAARTALGSGGFGHVYGMRYGIEGLMEDLLIDFSTLSTSVLDRLAATPASALGSCRLKLKEEHFDPIVSVLRKHDIHTILLIGGNDTMDTIHRLTEYCRNIGFALIGVGIPKTVDNDLFGTDHTPGYGSAARYVALSVQQAGRLAQDMQRVDKFVVHQTVGRDSGWLAAASSLAKRKEEEAPHLIYLPERAVTPERIVADVSDCVGRFGWASIVCGEGIVYQDGTPVSASTTRDRFSNVEFGAMGGTSAAINLHRLISDATGFRGEFQITESLSMCADDRVSAVDRREAYDCGAEAVRLALAGISGVMVSIVRAEAPKYATRLGTVPLAEIAVKAKPMPADFINSEGNFVTQKYWSYAAPLAGEFPEYAELK